MTRPIFFTPNPNGRAKFHLSRKPLHAHRERQRASGRLHTTPPLIHNEHLPQNDIEKVHPIHNPGCQPTSVFFRVHPWFPNTPNHTPSSRVYPWFPNTPNHKHTPLFNLYLQRPGTD